MNEVALARTFGCVGKAGENGGKLHTSCGEEEAELKPKNAARTAKIQVNGVIPDLGYANVCYKSLQCKVSLDRVAWENNLK